MIEKSKTKKSGIQGFISAVRGGLERNPIKPRLTINAYKFDPKRNIYISDAKAAKKHIESMTADELKAKLLKAFSLNISS